MNQIIPFHFDKITIRVIYVNNTPWFVARDVSAALDYRAAGDMVRMLDDEEKGTHLVHTPGGAQDVILITESGLYSAIMRSRKPEAKDFKKWVTAVVLPSVRKNGGYIAGQENTDDPMLIMAKALQVAQSVIDQSNRKLADANALLFDQAPKVEFYDQVTSSRDTIDLGEAAKVLNMGVGRNNLFKFLREQRILMPDNLPYQAYIDRGYFRVIEQKINKPRGEIAIGFKTVVYQRGLDYIRSRLDRTNH